MLVVSRQGVLHSQPILQGNRPENHWQALSYQRRNTVHQLGVDVRLANEGSLDAAETLERILGE